MALDNPKAGFNATSEFMISGLPWVISQSTVPGTITNHKFSNVTKNIIFSNTTLGGSKKIRIGFTENGVNDITNNYFVVDSGQILNFDARVKEVFIRADTIGATHTYSIYCSLTMIDSKMMSILTGSLDGKPYWQGVG